MPRPVNILRAVARRVAVAIGAVLVAFAFFSSLQNSLAIGW